MQARMLKAINFDPSENNNPVYEEIIGIFVDDSSGCGLKKINEYIASKPALNIIACIDDKFYPHYSISYVTVV